MSLRKPPRARLSLNDVACIRDGQQVLRHINLSLYEGSALTIVGPNGSGKTSFLRMLAGFCRPSAGDVLWNGRDITTREVFQQYKLQLNWISLKEAINPKLNPRENVRWFEYLESKKGKTDAALELMGLGTVAEEKIKKLSSGQRKRLQFARLLATDRPIWLLDEPTVAVDDDGIKLLEYIIAQHRKQGGIVITATHHPIAMEDSMVLSLPQRYPIRMTHTDMLP